MDIIKWSTDWARAEVFSAKIVWLFSVIELLTAIGFWYWGRTTMARAFIWPLLVMGLFLIAAFLMVVDSNTEARNDAYHSQLLAFKP